MLAERMEEAWAEQWWPANRYFWLPWLDVFLPASGCTRSALLSNWEYIPPKGAVPRICSRAALHPGRHFGSRKDAMPRKLSGHAPGAGCRRGDLTAAESY